MHHPCVTQASGKIFMRVLPWPYCIKSQLFKTNIFYSLWHFKNLPMLYVMFWSGAVGAGTGAITRLLKMIRLLAAPALQWIEEPTSALLCEYSAGSQWNVNKPTCRLATDFWITRTFLEGLWRIDIFPRKKIIERKVSKYFPTLLTIKLFKQIFIFVFLLVSSLMINFEL
jgi:hypothetical protein